MRRLALDLENVDGENDRRRAGSQEDRYLVWTYLVRSGLPPGRITIHRLLGELGRFRSASAVAGRHVVYPAGAGDAERAFPSLWDASDHLATTGGAILLNVFGTGIALIFDPSGRTHRELVRSGGLDDEVSFAEYAVWMPRPGRPPGRHEYAARIFMEALPGVERLLGPTFGYSVTTDDWAAVASRWPSHRQVSRREMPSELFWFQYFSAKYARELAIDDYRSAGCWSVRRPSGGTLVCLAEEPVPALEALPAARRMWRHGLTPTVVC
jgi:hypothetical protein